MKVKTLYKYNRDDGGVTVSSIMPEGEYSTMLRLIADAGKLLTDGDAVTPCVDVDSADGWYEIDAPEEEI